MIEVRVRGHPREPDASKVEVSAAAEKLEELRDADVGLHFASGHVLLLVLFLASFVRTMARLVDLFEHLKELRCQGLLKEGLKAEHRRRSVKRLHDRAVIA